MTDSENIIASDNIVSPLGLTSAENYAAVKSSCSALQRYEGLWNIPEAFVASLFDRDKMLCECEREGIKGTFTFFESIVILSISKALSCCSVDPSSPRTLFILSSTKGNVDMLGCPTELVDDERELLGVSARAVARYFHNTNQPIVVSNACTSGVCAQILAMRMLGTGEFDHVIVCGSDVQSKFIISGFQSFKALSAEACRPYDKDRCGLNLGEAAATIIYAARREDDNVGAWKAVRGAIRNDANHISGPSRTGEGSYRCLDYVMRDATVDELAFVNTHGTATLYNDEMESIAIDRAGLLSVPVNSMKGYYGHTMGAAGVLESILSMHAIDDHTVVGTRGFQTLGVSRAVNITSENRATRKQSFIKLISGFGGCNAALLFKKMGKEGER